MASIPRVAFFIDALAALGATEADAQSVGSRVYWTLKVFDTLREHDVPVTGGRWAIAIHGTRLPTLLHWLAK